MDVSKLDLVPEVICMALFSSFSFRFDLLSVNRLRWRRVQKFISIDY